MGLLFWHFWVLGQTQFNSTRLSGSEAGPYDTIPDTLSLKRVLFILDVKTGTNSQPHEMQMSTQRCCTEI